MARVSSLLDDAEHKDEIAQLAAAIEQALAQSAWNDARAQAEERDLKNFRAKLLFASLKRRADEGKYKARRLSVLWLLRQAREAPAILRTLRRLSPLGGNVGGKRSGLRSLGTRSRTPAPMKA